jgi:uncharacterized damage-inducible protein DinB
VISDIASFIRYFEGVHRRTVRDVSGLPEEAETWMPAPADDEEASWGIPRIVRHIAEARGFFASAFRGDGWVWTELEESPARGAWVPMLQRSFEDLERAIGDVRDERLTEKAELIGGFGRPVSAWRFLMMMAEHEVHHRSQLDTYAGLNGWPVQQIFGQRFEDVAALREEEERRARGE